MIGQRGDARLDRFSKLLRRCARFGEHGGLVGLNGRTHDRQCRITSLQQFAEFFLGARQRDARARHAHDRVRGFVSLERCGVVRVLRTRRPPVS